MPIAKAHHNDYYVKSLNNDATPYRVDKVFWLICSGNYYNENPPIRIKGQKKELIDYLINIH